jgi:UTP pyrophosphatase
MDNGEMSSVPAPSLRYLVGYPEPLLDQVRGLIAEQRLAAVLQAKYPDAHEVRTDKALFETVNERKQRFLRNAPPLSLVIYDNKLKVLQHALGTHTTVARVQGGKLKAKREIRIASLFKQAPAAFLDMIVVHELAHLKEREHDKAFYSLCEHMLRDYHQVEFDLRLYLTQLDLDAKAARQTSG